MPGAYAHLTMVNVAKESANLEKLNFSKPSASALLKYFKYCELGAVSPDYPYLAIGDSAAEKWADLMHYDRTGEVLRAGVLGAKALQGDQRERAFAWLLGYSAHVATDVTIHPVVELKVGPYAQNKTAHRVCEMHQDAYICGTRMNLGGVGVSKHLTSGILRCTEANQPDAVDSIVKSLWEQMLRSAHPAEAKTNPPQVDKWHKGFDLVVNKIAGEGHRLFPFARHVAANQGLTYPTFGEVDRKEYIDQLKAPTGTLHYDAIFDRARDSVGKAWGSIEKAVYGNDANAISFFGDWIWIRDATTRTNWCSGYENTTPRIIRSGGSALGLRARAEPSAGDAHQSIRPHKGGGGLRSCCSLWRHACGSAGGRAASPSDIPRPGPVSSVSGLFASRAPRRNFQLCTNVLERRKHSAPRGRRLYSQI